MKESETVSGVRTASSNGLIMILLSPPPACVSTGPSAATSGAPRRSDVRLMQAKSSRTYLGVLRYAAIAVALAAGVYGAGSLDWYRRGPGGDLRLQRSESAEGALLAGAARVDVEPPLPAVVAGYPPQRSEATRILYPLRARALVLQVDRLRIGLVSVDLLTMPDSLAAEIRTAVEDLKLAELWVTATHSHSSVGGYDRGLLAQFAGTGRYRPGVRSAVRRAAADALERAVASLAPATLELGEGAFPQLVAPRSEGEAPDGRLTRLVFRSNVAPVAQLVIFAAHPTLLPRQLDALAPDYPGLFSSDQESNGGGTTVFFQGALGNVTAAAVGDNPWKAPSEFADALSRSLAQVHLSPVVSPRAGFSRVSVALPQGDASRVAPRWLRRFGDNFLCMVAPPRAEISAFQIGPLKLVSLPGEPTPGAGHVLEVESGAQRAIALTNGYIGYIETPELVRSGIGESKRQYFEPELLQTLANAARVAVQNLAIKRGQAR